MAIKGSQARPQLQAFVVGCLLSESIYLHYKFWLKAYCFFQCQITDIFLSIWFMKACNSVE